MPSRLRRYRDRFAAMNAAYEAGESLGSRSTSPKGIVARIAYWTSLEVTAIYADALGGETAGPSFQK